MGNILFWLYLVNAVLFAFTIHMYFIKKGRNEFKVPISLFILFSTLIVSVVQAAITLYLLAA